MNLPSFPFRKGLFIKTVAMICALNLRAQEKEAYSTHLPQYEKDLLAVIENIERSSDRNDRLHFSDNLLSLLQDAMQEPGAMTYPFSSLRSLSDLRTEDGSFRIFTWELENENGMITYYGLVSYLVKDEVISERLLDSSTVISNAEYSRLKPDRWYGAIYYEIREVTYRKDRTIILLGLNRNRELIKQKIIEVVDLSDKLNFGKEVFDISGKIGVKRKVYSFSNEAEMSIWFDEESENTIIMDHLAPLNPSYKEKYEFYAPDLSFDALVFKKGLWKYESDYDARMPKNLKDRFYEMELPKEERIY